MNAIEIAKRLKDAIPTVVQHLWSGAAKHIGGQYKIGNIEGEPGESLVVYENSGRFQDFATGDRGDMLELLTLKYGNKIEAMKVAHNLLGIPQISVKRQEKTGAAWKKPIKDWTQLTEDKAPTVVKYLTEERKIPLEVLQTAKVRAKDDKFYVFVRHTHDDPPIACGATYIGVEKIVVDGKKKKEIKQSLAPLDTLYGHETADATKTNNDGHKYIVITEGQIDMLSLRSCGITNSVSVPSGVSDLKWIEASWDFLEQFKEIYLFFDNDDPGKDGLEKAASKLGHSRCRKCTLPSIYNDINEAHVANYDLWRPIKNAEEFKPSRLSSAGDLADEAIRILGAGRRQDQGISMLGWEDEESINFRVRPNELTILTGYPGDGKSTLFYQEIAYLIFQKKEPCFLASLEEDPEVILGLIAVQALARQYDPNKKNIHRAFLEVFKVLNEYLWIYNYRGRAQAKDVLKNAEYAVRRYGAKHVFFDSFSKTDLDIEDNKKCNEFVGIILNSMAETRAHYWAIAHPRKAENDIHDYKDMPGMNAIKGSAAIAIEAFNIITMWRNRAKAIMLAKANSTPDGVFESKKVKDESGQGFKKLTKQEILQKGDAVIWIGKQKVGGETGRHDLFFNPDCFRLERSQRNGENYSRPYAEDIFTEYLATKKQDAPDF